MDSKPKNLPHSYGVVLSYVSIDVGNYHIYLRTQTSSGEYATFYHFTNLVAVTLPHFLHTKKFLSPLMFSIFLHISKSCLQNNCLKNIFLLLMIALSDMAVEVVAML